MKKSIILTFMVLFCFVQISFGKTIRILMETVPDTRYIEELLPEFEKETGIKVETEVIGYVDMHSKLVPQLIASQGSYDLIVVDFYWVGEFTKAGWLMPLDDLVRRDNIDVNRYVPALMDLVGRVDGTIYMLPFYNYSMAMVYRKDLINDPKEKAAFKAKTGMDLKVPTSWPEYWKQVEFFTRDNDKDGQNDFFGTVIQGQRGDCVAMHWSNFLYSQGGSYNANDGEPLLDSAAAISAMAYYKEAIAKYSPEGSAGYCFDEAFNVVAQGNAYSLTTFNIMYAGFDDPKSSSVVGKIGITPNPGGGLNGAWGWAIPNSSTQKEDAWKFIKWVESFDIAKRRAMKGGAPTQSKIFTDSDILRKRPYYPILGKILAGAQEFPVFTYTTEFVEKVGRELNLAATGDKDLVEAMQDANKAYRKLLVKDGKLSN
jgi:multiple sugar transport system substrate-binding protein|tara:strand:+ start:372 stop:1655 length:1284 start_codon:yes stop_codon:yes gene_type:complete